MGTHRVADQLDLFQPPSRRPAPPIPATPEELPGVRAEIADILARAAAAYPPWPDWETVDREEKRFWLLNRTLPKDEAQANQTAFKVQFERLMEYDRS